MVSRVDMILGMQLAGDDSDDVVFSTPADSSSTGISNSFLQYNDPTPNGNTNRYMC